MANIICIGVLPSCEERDASGEFIEEIGAVDI